MRYCSRQSPARADRYWTPHWSDVAWAETLIPYAMRERRNRPVSVPIGDHDAFIRRVLDYERRYHFRWEDVDWQHLYSRNYYGLVRSGRRILYIDFAALPSRDSRSVCDGGDSFFGVEVDLRAMKVLSFARNATA